MLATSWHPLQSDQFRFPSVDEGNNLAPSTVLAPTSLAKVTLMFLIPDRSKILPWLCVERRFWGMPLGYISDILGEKVQIFCNKNCFVMVYTHKSPHRNIIYYWRAHCLCADVAFSTRVKEQRWQVWRLHEGVRGYDIFTFLGEWISLGTRLGPTRCLAEP